MNTAIFTRVSKTDGSQDPERQVRSLQEYAGQQGWQVIEVIREQGSGSKLPMQKRPAIQFLLKLARESKIQLVLLDELARLSRRPRDIDTILAELEALRIPVFILKHKIKTLLADGTRDPLAMLLISMIKEIAGIEAEDLSYRIKSGLQLAREKGVQLGRPAGSSLEDLDLVDKYPEAVQLLDQSYSLRKVAKFCQLSLGTVQKVSAARKRIQQQQREDPDYTI